MPVRRGIVGPYPPALHKLSSVRKSILRLYQHKLVPKLEDHYKSLKTYVSTASSTSEKERPK